MDAVAVPVLLDEAVVLPLRGDGAQSAPHLCVNRHHFLMEQGGQVKVLLQNLLPGLGFIKIVISHLQYVTPHVRLYLVAL